MLSVRVSCVIDIRWIKNTLENEGLVNRLEEDSGWIVGKRLWPGPKNIPHALFFVFFSVECQNHAHVVGSTRVWVSPWGFT